MLAIPKNIALRLEQLNSRARWKVRGHQTICEIVGFNNKKYASAPGANELEALENAMAEVEKVGAPMTPDQAAAKYGKVKAELDSKTAQLTEAEARVAELEKQLAAASAGKTAQLTEAEPGAESASNDDAGDSQPPAPRRRRS